MQVNTYEAKTNLSKILERILLGQEKKVVISRNGKPIAQIVPYSEPDSARRLGLAEGKWPELDLDSFNSSNAEIAEAFERGGV